jgi:hypothetical protein
LNNSAAILERLDTIIKNDLSGNKGTLNMVLSWFIKKKPPLKDDRPTVYSDNTDIVAANIRFRKGGWLSDDRWTVTWKIRGKIGRGSAEMSIDSQSIKGGNFSAFGIQFNYTVDWPSDYD